jgi:cysteinyl-tRNA synthetase
VRHLLLASHYRSPINYSEQSLQQSIRALERFYHCLKDLAVEDAKTLTNSRFEKAFYAAMDDDFNTPEAFGVLFEMVSEINRQKVDDPDAANQLGALLVRLAGILGVLQADPAEFLKGSASTTLDSDEIDRLVAARDQARADKDWGKADEIREQLSAMKVVVEDKSGTSTWRIEH